MDDDAAAMQMMMDQMRGNGVPAPVSNMNSANMNPSTGMMDAMSSLSIPTQPDAINSSNTHRRRESNLSLSQSIMNIQNMNKSKIN